MWGNNDHFDSNRGSEKVDHLLMRQRGHRHLADLHQSAALPEPSLPSVTVGLYLSNNALKVDMESQLPEGITAQGHLCCLTALSQQLKEECEEEEQDKSEGRRNE